MQRLKSKIMAILIAAILTVSIGASTMTLIPSASAHSPPWNIPTYAYIVAAPNPIGVGQTIDVYMWLDPVYGAAGGTTTIVPTNASTASAALLANNYRFQNYKLTITSPNGTSTTTPFAEVTDPTSDQYIAFTPTVVGTYTLTFNFPGQVYGAIDAAYPQGDGYQLSSLEGDYYEPSNATTTLTVQQTSIPAAVGSSPLPTAFWTRPIYGENTIWYTISSNWLGSGSAGYGGFPSPSQLFYHPDGVGSLTSHIMWTSPLESGGVVGGLFGVDSVQTATLDPASVGVGYFEGSAYQERFVNPIIVDGYLYYNSPIAFTAPYTGPLNCVNLETGQVVWSNPNILALSFAYVYNLWDPDQHGTFPPILVAASGGFFGSSVPGLSWECFDAYTGDAMFNVTGIPSGTAAVGSRW